MFRGRVCSYSVPIGYLLIIEYAKMLIRTCAERKASVSIDYGLLALLYSDNLPYNFCEQIGKEIRDISDEIPFDIPDSWEWVRLCGICQLTDGERIAGKQYNNLDARYMRRKGEAKILDSGKYVEKGTRLILVDGENSGEVFIAPENGYMGSTFKILWIAPSIFSSYILHFIDIHRMTLKYSKKGAAIPHLNKDVFFNLFVPIPPLNEQHKIVSKIEELLPFIEKYDKAETKLTKLNTDFPEALKKSILQEAVQGKLVLQNPDDEPASVLLERIRAEKQALVKAGKIKKDKHESFIVTRDKIPYEIIDGKERCIADEVPFELPECWCWCRLGDIIIDKPSNGLSPKGVDYETKVKNLTLTATTSGIFKADAFKYVDVSHDEAEKYWLHNGDILVQRSNSRELVGTSCIYYGNEKCYIYPDLMMRIHTFDEISIEYIDYVLKSPFVRKYYSQSASGTSASMPKINQQTVSLTLIPLPPFNEQKNIVSHIEELIQYCNNL